MKMKTICKWIFIIILSVLFLPVSGQENQDITKRLKEKYGSACYHDDANGGYYSIRTGNIFDVVRYEGACDLGGNVVVPPIYEKVYCHGDYYEVIKNGKVGICNSLGKECIPCKYEKLDWYQMNENNYAGGKLNNKWGIINKQGQDISPFKYDHVSPFQFKEYGCCEVMLNGKYGLADQGGKEIVPCEYDEVSPYQIKDYGCCTVKLNGKVGVVKAGKEIIPCKYDEIYTWELKTGKYVTVISGGLMGIVDQEGQEIIPCRYTGLIKDEDVVVFLCIGGLQLEDNYFPKGGKWGAFDLKKMRMIVPCQYAYMFNAKEGLLSFNQGGTLDSRRSNREIKTVGGKWGYVDMGGKVVVEAKYDEASGFDNGIAQVILNGVVGTFVNPISGTNLSISSGQKNVSVDINIPKITTKRDNVFAFIVVNEEYDGQSASYASNDGKVFKEYCEKRLGIPSQNIRFYENATYGNMVGMTNRIADIADAYEGDAMIIFYYSGLGTADEQTLENYLLPVDVSFSSLASTGFSLNKFYAEMNAMNTKLTLVLLDTSFSGCNREGKLLTSARGVHIAARNPLPSGNMLVFSASSDRQVAYSSEQMQHGLFTYSLLEKLQKSKSDVSLKDLSDYVTTFVKKESLKNFESVQAPKVSVSNQLTNTWVQIKF